MAAGIAEPRRRGPGWSDHGAAGLEVVRARQAGRGHRPVHGPAPAVPDLRADARGDAGRLRSRLGPRRGHLSATGSRRLGGRRRARRRDRLAGRVGLGATAAVKGSPPPRGRGSPGRRRPAGAASGVAARVTIRPRPPPPWPVESTAVTWRVDMSARRVLDDIADHTADTPSFDDRGPPYRVTAPARPRRPRGDAGM